MSLSSPRILFGLHSISPYNRADHTPYGILKVIGAANFAMSAAVDQLYGGAQRFSWAAETKTINADIACKVKAYPGFLFAQFLGASNTDNAAETGGSVTALVNAKGTSVVGTVGIASIGIDAGDEALLKFGKYVIVAASATTVDIYAYSDVDFPRGATPLVYQNDLLKVTTAPLTITQSSPIDIPGSGLLLNGGSGTIGMTTGDTATFSVRPINTGSSDIVIGNAATTFPAFGAVILAQKRADGEMFEVEAFNCIPGGFPMPLDEFAFSTTEIKITCVYDSVADAVFKIRAVVPTTFN